MNQALESSLKATFHFIIFQKIFFRLSDNNFLQKSIFFFITSFQSFAWVLFRFIFCSEGSHSVVDRSIIIIQEWIHLRLSSWNEYQWLWIDFVYALSTCVWCIDVDVDVNLVWLDENMQAFLKTNIAKTLGKTPTYMQYATFELYTLIRVFCSIIIHNNIKILCFHSIVIVVFNKMFKSGPITILLDEICLRCNSFLFEIQCTAYSMYVFWMDRSSDLLYEFRWSSRIAFNQANDGISFFNPFSSAQRLEM